MNAAEAVDFSGAWTRFWAQVQGVLTTEQTEKMGTIAVIFVVASLIGLLWSRSRGRGASSQGFMVMLVLAAMLASPGRIIPIILSVIDAIVNFVISMFTATG